MSALTKNERDGLDDVFLSIHTHTDKYQRIKNLATLIFSHQTSFNMRRLIKVAKYGLKETKLSRFISKLSEKKKNLSK